MGIKMVGLLHIIQNTRKYYLILEVVIMFKKNVVMMFVGLLVMAGVAGAVTVFDGTTGLAGWTTVYGVVPGSLSDGVSPFGAIGLSPNTGWSAYEPLNTLLFYSDKAVIPSSGFSSGVGAFTTASPDPSVLVPLEGSYVAVRYAAPAGQMITEVTIPQTYFFIQATPATLQIVDAAGIVKASAHASAAGAITVLNLSAIGLNTSAVEIRLSNVGGGQWTPAYWASNGVGLDKVEVATAPIPEPATMSLLGLGILGLLRKKHA